MGENGKNMHLPYNETASLTYSSSKTQGQRTDPCTVQHRHSTQKHSLVTQYVPVLIRVESKLENPIHHASLNGQLSILKLLFTRVLPYDVLGHRAIKELQEIFYLSSFIISCCEFLKVSNAK